MHDHNHQNPAARALLNLAVVELASQLRIDLEAWIKGLHPESGGNVEDLSDHDAAVFAICLGIAYKSIHPDQEVLCFRPPTLQ